MESVLPLDALLSVASWLEPADVIAWTTTCRSLVAERAQALNESEYALLCREWPQCKGWRWESPQRWRHALHTLHALEPRPSFWYIPSDTDAFVDADSPLHLTEYITHATYDITGLESISNGTLYRDRTLIVTVGEIAKEAIDYEGRGGGPDVSPRFVRYILGGHTMSPDRGRFPETWMATWTWLMKVKAWIARLYPEWFAAHEAGRALPELTHRYKAALIYYELMAEYMWHLLACDGDISAEVHQHLWIARRRDWCRDVLREFYRVQRYLYSCYVHGLDPVNELSASIIHWISRTEWSSYRLRRSCYRRSSGTDIELCPEWFA